MTTRLREACTVSTGTGGGDVAGDAEVIVVGAGVAGCAVALHLARRGHSVILLDRSESPRDKVCGEGLMPHGVAALDRLGLLPLPFPVLPFTGIGYHVAGVDAVGRFPGTVGL